jgi:ribosomal protein L7/L12
VSKAKQVSQYTTYRLDDEELLELLDAYMKGVPPGGPTRLLGVMRKELNVRQNEHWEAAMDRQLWIEDRGQAPQDLYLEAPGPNKVEVIKLIRSVTRLGLAEAKKLVDDAPKIVKQGLSINEAQEIRQQLIAAGATVRVVNHSAP